MNIDLLAQSVPLTLCILVTSMLVYILTRLDRHWRLKYFPAIVLIVFATTIMMERVLSYYVDDSLPSTFFFMIFPSALAIWLTIIIFIHKINLRIFAVVTICFSLLFTLVLINGYYRFYPTLYAVFNKNDLRHLANTEVSIKYSVQKNAATLPSIESSLTSLGQHRTGTVYSLNIPGTKSGFKAREAYVYTPAVASGVAKINLPVLVLSTGFPGLPSNWLGSGLQATMDKFAALHDGITPYVFMVDNTGSVTNDTECVNSPRGNAETYLTTDVPNYIKSHFEVATDPSHWAIGGLSMGGMCSVMLALRHPDVYQYFLDFGGEMGPEVGSNQKTIATLFGGSESEWAKHLPINLLRERKYNGMGGYFSSGKQDTLKITTATRKLYDLAKGAGIESVYESIDGKHTFNVWQQGFKDSLPWLSSHLGATVCVASCY